jgi:1-deoxy-D-xylulose-5-phosphate synthase
VHYQGIYQLPKLGKSDIISKGFKVAIMTDGNSYRLGKNVCEELKLRGITPTHINAHYMSKVDESLLNTLAQTHELAVTIEDGVLDGGYGEKVARFLGAAEMKVMCFGADKVFTNRVPLELLKVRYSLTPEMIVQRVVQGLKEDFDLVMGA